jgi:hypothetical protein
VLAQIQNEPITISSCHPPRMRRTQLARCERLKAREEITWVRRIRGE